MLYKFVTLIILDGFGIAPPHEGNAVFRAKKPNFDNLVKYYPHSVLQAAGEEVGLPSFEMGNSEVGHMNLGAGRVMYQELPKIDKAIKKGSFFQNPAFLAACNHAKKNNSKLHLIGLISENGVHAHSRHLFALLDLAKQQNLNKVFVHAFLDGRDSPRDAAKNFVANVEKKIKKVKLGKIANLVGRFYAMDRNKNWDRIEKAYNLLVKGEGEQAKDSRKAILESYKNQVFDEEFKPTLLNKDGLIENNDAVIFFNFRTDRAKQLTHAFVDEKFEGFPREKIKNLFFATMTEYDKGLPCDVAFPHEQVVNVLGEVISRAGLLQLRIAETEKYAHVTNFFNCQNKEPYQGEDRILIPSPKVISYDQKPEMSALEVTEKILPAILSKKYSLIILNFANPDMVGHTGNISAAIKGIEAMDVCLGKIVKTVFSQNGAVVICADHGNAEIMINLVTGEVDKEHSTSPVPLILAAPHLKLAMPSENTDLSVFSPCGVLSDVSPTVLKLLGISKPKEMTAISLY
ncbi:MAG: 2,3-bisphosphoglycerate-independent phosphoglycerate mutase [Patescibacteria group bacterium]